jgi:hypothetical protein
MTELLAVLTSIFVAYVLYEIYKTVSESDLETARPVAPAMPKAPAPAESAPPPAAAQAAPAPAAAKAPEPPKAATLRNPSTGEVSPVPGNYRFAKKWIKEAMVAEGLLKKVYKNSELTEAVSPQVKEALEQFKKLPQYHA